MKKQYFLILAMAAIAGGVAVAADGAKTKIAFSRDGDIYIMDPDGGNLINVTNTPELAEHCPRWSPAGTKISFAGNAPGEQHDIHVMNADGSNCLNLTNSPGIHEEHHSWSPDGTKITYLRSEGGWCPIWVMNANDGSNKIQLTCGPTDRNPDWSPDGNYIVFTRAMEPGAPITYDQIFVMNADGTNVHRLTYTAYGGWDYWPSWSPDGTKIIFASTRGGNWWRDQIFVGDFVINANGEPELLNQTNITSPPYRNGTPRWSPDGMRVVFVRAPYNTWNNDIWAMDADGSNPVQLTNTPGIAEIYPDWGNLNTPPLADAGPDQTVEQTSPLGADVQLDGSASCDPDGDTLTYDWTWWDGGPVSVSGPRPLVTLPPGLTIITLTVFDGLLSDADTVQITVEDTIAPVISIDAPIPYGLYPVGLALQFSATDAVGVTQLFGTLTDTAGTPQEVYPGFVPDAGVYTLVVSAIDGSGNRAESEPIMFVVYDATTGFVTGGGWINSPAGAHKTNPSLTGKATFGFVSKYKKGADVPTGNSEFQFKAANLNFHGSSYDWLVVTGSDYARFKGTGTINGFGAYKFMLWAGDRIPDTFRIKIWWEEGQTENVVYDNGMDQPISGGSIVVHAQ